MKTETQTYYVEMDGLENGENLQADSIESALIMAIAWTNAGDWPNSGCKINVRVWSEDEDGNPVEELRDVIEIPPVTKEEEDGEAY